MSRCALILLAAAVFVLGAEAKPAAAITRTEAVQIALST